MMEPDIPTVLLIEDNEVDREAVARLIGDELEIVPAATAAEGLALFEALRPHCVLLDYRLPDADGIEILQELVTRQAAVVVLTGQGSELIAVEAMKAGAEDYLVKGELSRDALRRAVSGAMARQSLETALGRSRDYNRALLDAIPDIIVRVRRDGTFLDYIPGDGDSPYGAPSEFLHRGVREVLPADIAERFMDCVERAFAAGGVQGLEFVLLAGQSRHTYEARVTVCGENEVVVITRDVTEQRSLEQRMLASQRMEAVGRLAGGIAHDFNNVLTLIQGYTGLLLEELDEDTRTHRELSIMRGAAERGAKLVRQLLAFSRRQTQQLELIDLGRAIAELSEILRRLIRESIELRLHEADSALLIEIDSTQLDQILMNLVVNARDAMPEGGTLTIATRSVELSEDDARRDGIDVPPGSYVRLEVRDTGIGMDAETQSRIFEPFFTTKAQGEGTGLGLATVYGIVKQNKGAITVSSEPGQGTCFTIYVPRVERAVAERPVERLAPSVLTGSETVLIVEDEEDVRRAVHGILERSGYLVLEASGGSEAISLCQAFTGPIHLLLSDVVMPRLSGRELAESILSRWPDLRVLFMSGYPDEILREHGLSRDTAPVLEKPFTPQSLLRAVRKVLDGRSPHDLLA